ncbi:hypothetical protein CJ030_MR2G011740 [Morella rubra]|uniref:Uncharacterized protein n=1 Tax=Morella rubra TaxID=262757 RepID=A0A6A1WIF5_9ROSI|nr:hypothetical protein CJ030_MR2G011740 [Morella rubra]
MKTQCSVKEAVGRERLRWWMASRVWEMREAEIELTSHLQFFGMDWAWSWAMSMGSAWSWSWAIVNGHAAIEKKKQGLLYGMFFTHMFHVLEVDMIGEKGVVTPQKGGEGGLDSEEEDEMRKRLTLKGLPQELGLLWVSRLPHCRLVHPPECQLLVLLSLA